MGRRRLRLRFCPCLWPQLPKGDLRTYIHVLSHLPRSHVDDTSNIININARYSRPGKRAIPRGEKKKKEEEVSHHYEEEDGRLDPAHFLSTATSGSE